MGRPLGALKGRTEQANEFARWLRRITNGVTVRTLEEDFPYGKSSWSGFRDGSRLPPADLVEQVAVRYLHEPAMRKRQLERGLSLLTAAERAAKALQDEVVAPPGADLSAVPAAQRRPDPWWLRLDEARLLQIEAMKQLAASEGRREYLEGMVSILEQRIAVLESERDRAREDVREELLRELLLSREYRRQAGESLKQAAQAVERARRYLLAADTQVARERHELLRVDADGTGGTALPPTPNGTAVAEELQLPPLHRIQEFLDANQEQLDALNDELDDLGEELGVQAAQGWNDDDSAVTRIVWEQVLDSADPAADLPAHAVDNPRKPLTSTDATHTARQIGPAAPPAAPSVATAPGRDAVSKELVVGLSSVSTPDALSVALSRLLRRAGVRSIRQLTATLPADMKDDVLGAAVGRWIDGDALPDTWPHLEALVRLMGATDDEAVAFQQAYERITHGRSAAWSNPDGDLSDFTPFIRGLHHLLRTSRLTRPRTGEWITAVLTPPLVVALTTAYTAGLQLSPRPGPMRLIAYGALLLTVCLFVLLVTTRVAVLCARRKGSAVHRRFSAVSLVVLGLLAVPAGLVLPWLLDSDTPGRWFAHLIGLV